MFLLAWQGALVKLQVLNFHISLGTQEHQIIKITLLTSHTLPASVLPTGRHLLSGNTQIGNSAGRKILHKSEAFSVYETVLLISVFSRCLDLLYKPGSTGDSNTFPNHYSFKYLLISKYCLNS